jgi:hypothetical protein
LWETIFVTMNNMLYEYALNRLLFMLSIDTADIVAQLWGWCHNLAYFKTTTKFQKKERTRDGNITPLVTILIIIDGSRVILFVSAPILNSCLSDDNRSVGRQPPLDFSVSLGTLCQIS